MKKHAEKFAGKEKSRTFATRLRKTRSSLTSLRKDNEVKLEDEINQSVTSIDRESIVMLWTAISRQRVNENKC